MAKKYKTPEIPSKKRTRDDSNGDARVKIVKKKKVDEIETVSHSSICTTNVDIPPELWMKIFQFVVEEEGALQFLPRASRVCRSWYEMTILPSLWEKVDLSYVLAKGGEKCMEWLCKNRLVKTTDLNLARCKEVNSKILKMISQNCPNLRSINLSYCKKCPSETLTILTEGCKLLEDVDVSFTNKRVVSSIPLRRFVNIQGSCLKHLTLGGNTFAGFDLVLSSLMKKCPNLELLDISNAQFSNNNMAFNIEKFQAGCPKLKILRLANTPFIANECSQEEQALSGGFPHLQELSIAYSSTGTVHISIGDTDNCINRILKTSSKLKLLDIRGNTQDKCIRSLSELPIEGLERLYMSNCAVARFKKLQDLMKKWKHSLLEVDLSNNSFDDDILDPALYAITQGEGDSPLQRLNIARTLVNQLTVQSILKHCKDLHYLNLTSCRAIPRGFKREYGNRLEIDKLREDILNYIVTCEKKEMLISYCEK